jgi:pyruvate kinase
MKRTKIVCTIGPATDTVPKLVQLGKAGMDVARLNFSHGTHDYHRQLVQRLQEAGKKIGRPFGILQDLQGPKIRVGDLPKEGVNLYTGNEAVFSTAKKVQTGDIPVTLPTLHRDVKPGEHLLLDDGLLEVQVEKVSGNRIITQVVQGGVLLSHKGLNLPGTYLRIPALSKKDREDALFGVRLGVDYIALSFVRTAEDVKELRRLLDRSESGKKIKIIAKIEKREAIENFEKILPLCGGIMIARGDLGIETPAEQVPIVQKQLVARAREASIPVIVATQMLDSMQRNPRPTRAEVSDVANAVADHADAVMLSGETASGKFPVQAVKIMADTIRTMEDSVFDDLNPIHVTTPRDIAHVVGASVRLLSEALKRAPILVTTGTGRMARVISSFRPETSIFAYTFDEHVARLMNVVWGVQSHAIALKPKAETNVEVALADLKKKKLVKKGQKVILVMEFNQRQKMEIVTVK